MRMKLKYSAGFLLMSCLCAQPAAFAGDETTDTEEARTIDIKEKEGKEKKKALSLTGNITTTTDYLFRGLSQTDGRPAYQGNLTLTAEKIGVYATAWGSNTRLISDDQWATLEVDTILGITNALTDKLTYDLHFIRYNYPATTLFSYNETIGSVTYGFLTALIGYSTNVLNTHGSGTYYNLAAQFDLPEKDFLIEGLNIAGGIGHYHLSPIVGKSYNDYTIALTKSIKNVKITLAWVDTNHKFFDNRLDRGRIVATLNIKI